MKIMYFSCHEVLERDEISLLTELGHDVFSFQGAYMHPEGHPLLKRLPIGGMTYHQELAEEAVLYAKTKVPKEFFEWADVIMIMHDPNILNENWDRMKHKPVIWRSIGQSTPYVENMVRPHWFEGMKIVRMSPMEENITGYVGANAMIRFYKDPVEWKDWNGDTKRVINFTQSLLSRRQFCHYDQIMAVINGFPSLIYGSGNTDLGALDGGELPFTLMQGALRDNRCFVYGGTWPSPYTLGFQEAFMAGIPVVAIGKTLAESVVPEPDRIDFYEIGNFIENEKNGFISDNINELREYVHRLLENQELAQKIGEQGRKTAIKLFNKDDIKYKWSEFFKNL